MRMTRLAKSISIPVTAALAATLITGPASASIADGPVTALGTHDNGAAGTAEISAHDPSTQRIFTVDGANNQLVILDATDMSLVAEVATSGPPTSVAVRPAAAGTVVVAVSVSNGTDPGSVELYDTDGALLSTTTVGDFAAGIDASLPDMVTFTPDGTKLLVANEGEYDPGDQTVAADDTDPEGGVTILDIAADGTVATITELDFRGFNAGEAGDLTVTPEGFHLDPTAASVAQDLEPEYIAASDTVAWVTLQEANGLARIDLATSTITDVFPLGYIDRGVVGLDGSDKDGAINIATYPGVFSVRMPDSVAMFSVAGTDYLVTANEGDARALDVADVGGDGDSAEYKVADVAIDDAGDLDAGYQTDEAIGPLLVTPYLGDTDADPEYEELYTFGGRSFSIFSYDGVDFTEVFDSGADFEQYIADNLPAGAFNADGPIAVDETDPANPVLVPATDNRSDNKGPEPEGVTLGEIDGVTYAFVGLERQGGVMVYDVTDPTAPTFVQYINGRNLVDYQRGVLDWDNDGVLSAGDALDYETNGGDVSPEGLAFVSAADSPTGSALLVVTNEISGTVTAYDLELDVAAPPAAATVDGSRDLGLEVVRTAGEDRVATSVEVSKVAFPDGAKTVVVATADNYADALTGGPLAAKLGAPIILTKRDNFTPSAKAEIQRLDPDKIIVLGGPVAIDEPTYAAIAALASTRRLAGENRFATAALINDELVGDTSPERVFVVEGTNPSPTRGWPDAVSVSAYAAFTGTPIVPIASNAVPSDSAASLTALDPSEFVVIGGPVAIADDTLALLTDDENDTVRRLSGETRFDTSAVVYDEAVTQGLGTSEKWLATGRKFPDALTGGAAAGQLGHSLLLVESANGTTSIPATVDRLTSAYDTIKTVRILGGPIAIPVADETAVRDLLTYEEPAETDFCLTILHNNDGESQLIDAGRGLEDFGGAARFATTMLRERDRATEARSDCTDTGVLTLSSGDNFLGGPEFSAARANGVPLYDATLYDYLNYDAIDLGNHDFDFGLPVLNDFIRSFSDGTPFLSSNVDTGVSGPMATLVNTDRLKPSTVVDVAGRKVGIVGVTTPTLRSISSPGGSRIAGVAEDGSEDLDGLAAVVQGEIDKVTADGAEVVVVISHLQALSNDQALIPLLSGVDVVVGGGGNEILATPGELLAPGDETGIFGSYPLLETDLDGTTVPLVTTAGSYKYAGRLGVRFDDTGALVDVDRDSRMVRVADESVFDGVAGDAFVQANIIDPVEAYTATLADEVIATTDVPLDGVRQRVRTQETNIGALLADGLANAAATRAAEFGLDNGDPFVGVANGGGIRNDSVIEVGDVTTLDTFDIAPFSNLVAVFTDVTPAELDTLLEHAYGNVENVDGRFAQLGGLEADVDLAAAPGERVSNIRLQGGAAITTVNLAMPDFSARGGDSYPTEDFGDFTIVGLTYQEALAEWIAELGTIGAADYPDLRESTAGALRIHYV